MRLSKDVVEVMKKLQPDKFGRSGGIIVKLKKALYGLVTASKLWYERLCSVLSRIGLLAHPYEACVFHGSFRSNNVVIACYVDVLLICHDGDFRFPEYLIAVFQGSEVRYRKSTYIYWYENQQV